MRSTSLRTVLGWLVRLELCTVQRPLGRRILAGSLFGSAIVCAVVLLGQRLTASFITTPRYAAGAGSTSVAVGDFNGDGIPDLALANYGSSPNYTDGGLTILLGNGDGTFQAPQSYRIGASALSVAIGDFNSDGKLDLVTANGNGTINVLLGNGDGTFQAAQSFAPGFSGLKSAAVADFNGDGKLDLAVAGETKDVTDVVSILLGNGDGTFQAPQNYSTAATLAVAVGDFNGDGKADLASVGGQTLSIFLGNGDGTFQPAASYAAGRFSQGLAVGDFNGDGISDIAVADADINGDALKILLGNRDGTFQPVQSYAASFRQTSVAIGDFNHDGRLDLAVGSSTGTVSILVGNGNGTFQAPQGFAAQGYFLAVADFNGDGHLDIAAAGGGVFILLGKGDATFQAAPAYALDFEVVSAVAVGDFNGDGIPDLAVANSLYSGTVLILMGKGDGTFQPAQRYPAGRYPMSLVVADWNGDGIPDLAVLTFESPSTVQIWYGNGDGTFRSGPSYAVGPYARSLAVGDFNGDGAPDLVVANTGILVVADQTVSVLLNHGDGTFQAAQNYAVGGYPSAVAVGDFNGDGILDLVAILGDGPSSNTYSILLGNGDGTFQPANPYTIPFQLYFVAVGDFNGDGILDLASTVPGASVIILLGNADGTFQATQNYAPGVVEGPIALGDFNRDGALDFVLGLNMGVAAVSLGNGDGTFQAAQHFPVGLTPLPIAVADFNGDGYPDLAVGYSGGVAILLNAADW
ncbi:MAG TPA: VCBS repeat-containing protein [Gemmataceae bacterium]|nr:VCBS repeat-containing protein [Gemmataceae bacterium]